MIVLSVANCPAGLRGDLSKWLCEINTGVYVGGINARVREELWERVCKNIKNGQATMVYSINNEQGYGFRTHHTTWRPVDYEGITLMQKPCMQKEDGEGAHFLPPGFSKAAKFETVKHFLNYAEAKGYVILEIKTTGLDCKRDRILEIGLLKVREGAVEEQFQCLIRSSQVIADSITEKTGITKEMTQRDGLAEREALERIREFIGDDPVVSSNLKLCLDFIQMLGRQSGNPLMIRQTRDVMQLARRKLEDLEDVSLDTVAARFSLKPDKIRRALPDCILTHQVYLELNKL